MAQQPDVDASDFTAPYLFKASNVEVVIQTTFVDSNGVINFLRIHRGDGKGSGKYIKAKGRLKNSCNFHRFRVELLNGNVMKFKAHLTGKYVRVKALGGIDCDGAGGKFCEFIVHRQGGSNVKLESNHKRGINIHHLTSSHILSRIYKGKYLVIDHNGLLTTGAGTNFAFFRRSVGGNQGGGGQHRPNPPQQAAFSNHYLFAKINTVCIRYPDNNMKKNGFLRCAPNAKQQLDVNGARGGPLAQFLAIPKGNICTFKNIAGGGYLRIRGNNTIDCGGVANGKFTEFKVHKVGNGKVKLESNVPNLKGKYIAVQGQNNLNIGGGGPWTVMEVFRKN